MSASAISAAGRGSALRRSRGRPPSGRRGLAFARLFGAAAVLAVLVQQLGTGPFLSGLRSVSIEAVIGVCVLTVLTTVCSARRWCLVASGLGVPVRFRTAVAAYYRSQFLNSALPGGILGDLHRGARHGRDSGNLGRGLRAVAWERTAGQVVQLSVAVLVLCATQSPGRVGLPVVSVCVAACAAVAAGVVRAAAGGGSSRWTRAARAVVADVRGGVTARGRWRGIVANSMVVVAGHAAMFVIAARAVGSTASLAALLPLTMLVLLGAAVPMNLGGWGPREGVAAWAFAGAGLGGAQGVAAATAFGVLSAAATLPGAVVLVAGWLGRRASSPEPANAPPAVGATIGKRHG